MTRLMSRGLRLIMLALLLVFAAAQPAAAQSILRDSETELLFKDVSRPLIEAAGLDVEVIRRFDYFAGSASADTRRVAHGLGAHTIVLRGAKA